MKILDNKSSSHYKELKDLAIDSEEMIIVSPFLSRDINNLLESLTTASSITRITLITVLNAYDEAVEKPAILMNFLRFCNESNMSFQLFIDDSLHSKVYLFKKDGHLHSAIITSANFTSKGLTKNHETGIKISDEGVLKELEQSMHADCRPVTQEDVSRMLDAAKKHKEKYGTHHHKTPVFNPWDHVALADGAQVLPLDRNYYIKPVGCAEDPYEDHMPIGPKLFFSKTKPHVQSGDILICYAVGPLDLLGYYEILSPPEYDDSNERWPWFVMTKCLSPQYSARFWESNLKLTETVRSYNKQYPDDPVTVAGNKTLGALQWGKDKIKLDRDFAEHLISLIQLAGALE